MALELQRRVVELVASCYDGELVAATTPPWLMRPGRSECGSRWPLVSSIFEELTGSALPDEVPPRERRQVDAVLRRPDGGLRILEVDESQHFNRFRAATLRLYPTDLQVAFDREAWIDRCAQAGRLPGGGFAKPRPPLFPGEGGRHLQRAFRDALADILPVEHGWLPTLRIADFEVASWVRGSSAEQRIAALLVTKAC
jgi:hypothetical protein